MGELARPLPRSRHARLLARPPRARSPRRFRGLRRMIRRTHIKPGFMAALLHRLSGIALAIFLPLHFLALGTALSGADRLDAFFNLTHNIGVRTAEWGLVTALALHLALGLRVLILESAGWRERTASLVSGCVAGSLAVGILFLLN